MFRSWGRIGPSFGSSGREIKKKEGSGKGDKETTTPYHFRIELRASKKEQCPVQGQLALARTTGENRVGSLLNTIAPQKGLRAELVFVLGTAQGTRPYIPSTTWNRKRGDVT
jgi:hypothetical protein